MTVGPRSTPSAARRLLGRFTPSAADDGPPVNPERSRLPSTDRRPQSAVSPTPTPPRPNAPTPARPKETRLLPMRLQIVPATDRGGDRKPLGRAGPGGPQFPGPPAQTAGIGSFSTNGSRKGVSVRAWHSSCGSNGMHMRTMHCATAETGFRLGGRSPRCAFRKSLF